MNCCNTDSACTTAIIFDVDGVLLELTTDEEEVFFEALSRWVPTHNLSRDWNSYRTRNDEDIIREILQRHGLPIEHSPEVVQHYLQLLHQHLDKGKVASKAVTGARLLLKELQGKHHLGIATANLRGAAKLRLQQVGFWGPVSSHAEGADGGGHKSQILHRLLARMGLQANRIVYIGDNVNDVQAGLANGVHFIGFSQNSARCAALTQAGAVNISTDHEQTFRMIASLLA